MQVVDCSDGLVPAFTRWTVPSGITRWMVESNGIIITSTCVNIERWWPFGDFGLTVAMDRDALETGIHLGLRLSHCLQCRLLRGNRDKS